MPGLLTDEAVAEALADLEGWNLVDSGKAIEAEFTFKGFNAAFGFISRVALAAERQNHIRNGRMSITASPFAGRHIPKVA